MIRSLAFATALLLTTSFLLAEDAKPAAKAEAKPAPKKVDIGTQAPDFKFKDRSEEHTSELQSL